MEQNGELHSKIGEFIRDEILVDVTIDLVETEKRSLTEQKILNIKTYTRKKVETVKESYLQRKK